MDDGKKTETHPKEAGVLDTIFGDADEDGNLTERGVVVTETEEVDE